MSDQFSEIPERVDALRIAIMKQRYKPRDWEYDFDQDWAPIGLTPSLLEDVLTALCNLTLTCQEILDELRSPQED